MKHIRRRTLFLSITLSLAAFIFYYLFHTGNFIYWRNPKLMFEPVIPSYLAKYPVFEDCLTPSHKYFNNLEKRKTVPTISEAEKLEKEYTALSQLNLRDGYKLGRVRKINYIFPDPVYCEGYFYPAVKQMDNKKLLDNEDLGNAFIINNEEDLKNLGILLYGDPKDDFIKDRYKSWSSLKTCSEERNFSCIVKYSDFPESINDGQIKIENDKKTLYRFAVSGISTHTLSYIALTIEEEGHVNIISADLISYKSGIIY